MVLTSKLINPAVALLTLSVRALPLENHPKPSQVLVQRDNHFRLECGNAPRVVAGNFLYPSNVPVLEKNHRLTTPPPLSRSDENFMDYLWCTPNTTTYTFFGVGTVDIPSQFYDINGALAQGIARLAPHIDKYGDGALMGGHWSIAPPETNIEIWVQNSKGTMTYGVLLSALTGLSQVAIAYIHEKKTMVFQINDGRLGELGIGYVGYKYSGTDGECVYDVVNSTALLCEDIRQGMVII